MASNVKLTMLEKAQISREYEIESICEELQDDYKLTKEMAEQLAERVYNGVVNSLGEILPDIKKDVISIILEEQKKM